MLNLHLIITVLIVLFVLVFAAFLAYLDFIAAKKRKEFNLLNAKNSRVKFYYPMLKTLYPSLLGLDFILSWFAYILFTLVTIVFFYFDYYITSFCFLLMSFMMIITRKILRKHEISPKYYSKFAIINFSACFVLGAIGAYAFINHFFGFTLDKELSEKIGKETINYRLCTTDLHKKYSEANVLHKELDNCNSIEKNKEQSMEFMVQLHDCSKPYSDNKVVMTYDWINQVYVRPQIELHFKKLKSKNQCK